MARQLADWASPLATGRANNFKEQELLPDFLTLYFHGGLFADDPLLDSLQVADPVCGYFPRILRIRLPPRRAGRFVGYARCYNCR